MALKLLTGPPGSGRTFHLLAKAREACDSGRTVWWLGLPAQRAHVLARLTTDGYAALGFEFMSAQQLYYRLLTGARTLRPLVAGTARLVRVVEALRAVTGALPTPGEAKLFAAAIAEAKRFGLAPSDYEPLAQDHEQLKFLRVYRAYEAGMTGVWDYDDARSEALKLVSAGRVDVGAGLVIADGLREVGPLELRFLRGLSRSVEVWLGLPDPPPGLTPDERLPAREDVTVERFAAANPVAEGRWVMRSIKQDLFRDGLRPLDLAIVAPPGRASALVALAEEYGVPLMDETPWAIASEGPGRALVDLLELRELPTPTRLFAAPGLAELGRLALEHGVAGNEAVTELARSYGLGEAWARWRERLRVRGDPLEWAQGLLREALPDAPPELVEQALGKAQEAARLGVGEGFTAWWVALLQDARQPRRQGAGVALLDATLVSGRRYRKAYVLGAVEGAYGAGEREDYFLPEEARQDLEATFAHLGLPRRFQGRWRRVADELLHRADHVVVSAPLGDQGGPLVLDEALFGPIPPAELPLVPAGSRLELSETAPFAPDLSPVELGRPLVESLRRYHACSFRFWGERVMRAAGFLEHPRDEATALRAELTREKGGHLSSSRREELQAAYPGFAGWLEEHAETLERLTYGPLFGGREGYAAAYLHATDKTRSPGGGWKVTIYRFVPWAQAWDAESAEAALDDRWSEYWAAGALFEQPAFGVSEVRIVVWPLGGDPIDLAPRGVGPGWARVREKRRLVRETLPAFMRGEVRPNPGFICRDCPVFDLCREGVR